MENESFFNSLCKYDYISLVKFLLQTESIDVNTFIIYNNILIQFKNMLFKCNLKLSHNKPALYIAVEKGNIEIIKLLLDMKTINVNLKTIYDYYF